MPAIERPNDGDRAADDQILRHECILTLRGPALHVIEVAPRVAAVIAVVPHHKDVVTGTTTSNLMADGCTCTPSGPVYR